MNTKWFFVLLLFAVPCAAMQKGHNYLRLERLEETIDCDDERKNTRVDHKSLLLLLIEAHRKALAENTSSFVPLLLFIQKIERGDIDLFNLKGERVLITEKDWRFRLLSNIRWSGVPVKTQQGYYRPLFLGNETAYLAIDIESTVPNPTMVHTLKDFSTAKEVTGKNIPDLIEEVKQILSKKELESKNIPDYFKLRGVSS